MSRIIVPLDRSELAEEALGWASLLARTLGDSLHLLTVMADESEAAEAAGYLKQVAARPELAGIEVTTETRTGDPAAEITDACFEGTSMVVITSHGRGGFKRLIHGSVADEIVRSALVPILVDKSGGVSPSLTNVLVTLDGSERSELALRPAREIARAAGVPLHILRVYNPMAEFTMTPMGPMADMGDIAQKLYEAAEAYMNEAAVEGEIWEVRSGRPLDVIMDYAAEKHCELIIMGTHGRGGIIRLALGSTSDAVVRAADRPVLLIPGGPEN